MEYLGHREGRGEGRILSCCLGGTEHKVIGRVTFWMRLKMPEWILPTLKSVMVIKVARAPLTI